MMESEHELMESSSKGNLVSPRQGRRRSSSQVDERKKRRPEFLNSVPRFYHLNNDALLADVWEALHKGQSAWLSATEVLALLEYCKLMGIGARAPHRPPSGAFFYFDARAGEFFRRDGYDYVKKKGSGISVREDHVKLRVGAVAIIYASYVHSAEWVEKSSGTSLFHRRSYWLVDSNEKDRGVIVHYLGAPSEDPNYPVEPVTRLHDAVKCECLLCCLKRENSKPDRPGESLEQILSRAQDRPRGKKKKPGNLVGGSSSNTTTGGNQNGEIQKRKKKGNKNNRSTSSDDEEDEDDEDEEVDSDASFSSVSEETKRLLDERRKERASRRRAAAPQKSVMDTTSDSGDDSEEEKLDRSGRNLPPPPPLHVSTSTSPPSFNPPTNASNNLMNEDHHHIHQQQQQSKSWRDNQYYGLDYPSFDEHMSGNSPFLAPYQHRPDGLDLSSPMNSMNSRRISILDLDNDFIDPLATPLSMQKVKMENPMSTEVYTFPAVFGEKEDSLMEEEEEDYRHQPMNKPSSSSSSSSQQGFPRFPPSNSNLPPHPSSSSATTNRVTDPTKVKKKEMKPQQQQYQSTAPQQQQQQQQIKDTNTKQQGQFKAASDSSKPAVRFDPNNLLISEYTPDRCREGTKILVVIGMGRAPETLNHRTWVEKVFPKLSVWFGEYRIPNIENIAIGVIRFICPRPFRQQEQPLMMTSSSTATGNNKVYFYENKQEAVAYVVRLEAKTTMTIPLKPELVPPCWERENKRAREYATTSGNITPIHYKRRSYTTLFEDEAGKNEEVEEEVQADDEEEELDRRATDMVEKVVRLMTADQHALNAAELINEVSPESGLNFLHTAVFCGASTEVIVMLLNHGADPNVKTGSDGNTALHLACEQGNVGCVKVLLHAGAKYNLLNDKGCTPMDMILSREEYENDNELFALLDQSTGTPNSPRRISSPRIVQSPPRPISQQQSSTNMNDPVGPTHMKLLREALNSLTLQEQFTLSLAVGDQKRRSNSVVSIENNQQVASPSSLISQPPLASSSSSAPQSSTTINLPMQPIQLSIPPLMTNNNEEVHEDDVSQVILENQPNLAAAMDQMKDSEKEVLNVEARKIQSNVRSWILRRQYLEIKEATKKVQALAKGHLARRHFRELQEKASATLVIQKSLRAHIKAKRLQKQQQLEQQQQQQQQQYPAQHDDPSRLLLSASKDFSIADELLLSSDDLLFDVNMRDE